MYNWKIVCTKQCTEISKNKSDVTLQNVLEESTINVGVFFFDVKNVEAGECEDKEEWTRETNGTTTNHHLRIHLVIIFFLLYLSFALRTTSNWLYQISTNFNNLELASGFWGYTRTLVEASWIVHKKSYKSSITHLINWSSCIIAECCPKTTQKYLRTCWITYYLQVSVWILTY